MASTGRQAHLGSSHGCRRPRRRRWAVCTRQPPAAASSHPFAGGGRARRPVVSSKQRTYVRHVPAPRKRPTTTDPCHLPTFAVDMAGRSICRWGGVDASLWLPGHATRNAAVKGHDTSAATASGPLFLSSRLRVWGPEDALETPLNRIELGTVYRSSSSMVACRAGGRLAQHARVARGHGRWTRGQVVAMVRARCGAVYPLPLPLCFFLCSRGPGVNWVSTTPVQG